MKDIKFSYQELRALLQIFLLREYHPSTKKITDVETLAYFKKVLPQSNENDKKTDKTKIVATIPSVTLATTKPQIISSPLVTPIKNVQPVESNSNSVPPIPVAEPIIPAANIQPKFATIETKAKNIKPTKYFSIEPLAPAVTEKNYRELEQLFQNKFSFIPIYKHIPSDNIAKDIKNNWLKHILSPEIVLITFNDNAVSLKFLTNIAQAISFKGIQVQIVSAKDVEPQSGWHNLLSSANIRLVIANQRNLYADSRIMHFHSERAQENKHFLNRIPLILLTDFDLYFQQPQLKIALWRTICQYL